MAGWMAIVGSAFIVVAAFEYVGRLRTVQGREAVAESLRDSAQGGLGLPLDDWLQILHVSSLVTAAVMITSNRRAQRRPRMRKIVQNSTA